MIHHISIAVSNPQHVATVMAEIFQGHIAPFSSNSDSYVTLAGDEFGTLIEFYPMGSELIPNSFLGESGFRINPQPVQCCAFQAAISVPISFEELERIGNREGWRVLFANREEVFDVVEFWVENRLMLELLTPTMTAKYRAVLHPEHLPALVKQLSQVAAR